MSDQVKEKNKIGEKTKIGIWAAAGVIVGAAALYLGTIFMADKPAEEDQAHGMSAAKFMGDMDL